MSSRKKKPVDAMKNGNRIQVLPDVSDPRFVWLKLDRAILAGLLIVLSAIVLVMVWTSLHNARTDDTLTREVIQLRRDINSSQRIINNANAVSEASVDFWRCAFLIQPDVEKTPDVIETCIDQARFPQHVKENR